MARGGFRRDRFSGALTHQPTRYPLDRRGTGSGGPPGPPGPPGSDDVTGSNINTRGVGVFDQKVGGDLQFRGIDDPTNRIIVTLDTTDHVIDLDIDEDALTTLAHLALANTFTGTNTFTGPVDMREYLDIDDTGADPGNPAAFRFRLFTRISGGNIELVARTYLGDECVLCSHSISTVTNTLPIMWVEV